MKKIVCLLCVCTLLIGLCACGTTPKETASNEPDTTKTETPKKETEEKEPEILDPVDINWLTYNEVTEEGEFIAEVEEKYNCNFNFWHVDKERYLELLGVKLASNEVPDTFGLAQDTSIQPYIRQGVAAEITEDMFAKIPDYLESYKDFNQDGNLFIDTMYQGKIYGLKGVSLHASYPTVLVWNKQWLKNVGINKIPETIEEFEEAMYRFANNDPDGNGVNDTYGMSQSVMNAVFGAFGPVPLKEFRGKGRQKCFMYTDDNNHLEFAVTMPEMKEALALLQKWYKDGIIDPEFITGENTGGYWAISQAFINGKIGITGMVMPYHFKPELTDDPNDLGGRVYQEYKKIHPDHVFGEDLDIGPAIVGPNGASGTHTWGSRGGKFIITTAATAEPRKLDVILNLINDNASDTEQAIKLAKGLEGVHYTINSSGEYISTDPDAFKNIGLGLLSTGSDPYNPKIYSPNEMKFMDEYRSTGYEDAIYPTVDAHAKYNNDLNRLALESYISIITGEEDIDYFETFVDTFNKSGGNEIREQINEAYQEILGN